VKNHLNVGENENVMVGEMFAIVNGEEESLSLHGFHYISSFTFLYTL